MRLVRWLGPNGQQAGRVDGDRVTPVDGTVLALATRAMCQPGWTAPAAGESVPLDGLTLEAPVERPGSLRDFYAFEAHVTVARAGRGLEMDPGWYERPVFYFSNPGTLLGSGADVPVHPRTAQLDFELELAWLIGTDVAGADESAAAAAVVGYTVMNDWSARDVQRQEMALNLGPAKGKDFATSLGPVVVTADEFDPTSGAMRAWVNGRLYSEADLGDCYWSIPTMTAYAAEATVVRAGDLCGTGTCGTGCILELSLTHDREAFPWLQAGDVVELEIEGLGRLTNRVVPSASPPWRRPG